jgi:hypothetical protein
MIQKLILQNFPFKNKISIRVIGKRSSLVVKWFSGIADYGLSLVLKEIVIIENINGALFIRKKSLAKKY